MPGLKHELDEKLNSRLGVEQELLQAKAQVDELEHALRELDAERHKLQESNQLLRDDLVTRKLNIEGATVKRAALEQQLQENNYQLEEVIQALPEGISESSCETDLEQIAGRIQRLGPINLAAIDEYSVQSQRKIYLDAQNDELERALDTLQNAIRKIDKETRTRFKETFDKINNGLQQLFPKVFGGGHA